MTGFDRAVLQYALGVVLVAVLSARWSALANITDRHRRHPAAYHVLSGGAALKSSGRS